MKLNITQVIVATVACGLLYLASCADIVSAQEDKTAGESQPSMEELAKGVWRDGKAVFSDYQMLDVFWKHSRGYKPKQPINFSHEIHVVKNKMECQYCHSGVAKSSYATMPSVELCMGCHKYVKTDSAEIKKLKKHFDEKIPLEWEPVHHLPEHAYFNHERHVKGGVACYTCHGNVPEMKKVQKVSSLKMGWCVSCHRERGASIDCSVCHK